MKIIIRCTLGLVVSISFYCSQLLAAETKTPLLTEQCPKVNCDCSSVPEGKWQSLCEARERLISQECLTNGGRPKSYCGLHGPDAYPVATSVQFDERPQLDLDLKAETLKKIIDTQVWSLRDDYKVLKSKEESGKVGDAIQVFGIYRQNAQKLFELQQQVVLGLTAMGKLDLAATEAVAFTLHSKEMAETLNNYGESLWEKVLSAKGNSNQPYKSLAFKVSRESITELERVAELYSKDPASYREAASYWQKAAQETKKILYWEKSSSNKAKYIAFYQQQVTSRLNRATLYWILADSDEKVAENLEKVKSTLYPQEEAIIRSVGEADLAANID